MQYVATTGLYDLSVLISASLAFPTQVDSAWSPVRGGLLQESAGICSPAHVGHLVLCSALQGKNLVYHLVSDFLWLCCSILPVITFD